MYEDDILAAYKVKYEDDIMLTKCSLHTLLPSWQPELILTLGSGRAWAERRQRVPALPGCIGLVAAVLRVVNPPNSIQSLIIISN